MWYQRPGVVWGGGGGCAEGGGGGRWWGEIGTSGGYHGVRRMEEEEEEERGVVEEVSVWWGAHASKETMRGVPASGGGRGRVGSGGEDVAAAGKHRRAAKP